MSKRESWQISRPMVRFDDYNFYGPNIFRSRKKMSSKFLPNWVIMNIIKAVENNVFFNRKGVGGEISMTNSITFNVYFYQNLPLG